MSEYFCFSGYGDSVHTMFMGTDPDMIKGHQCRFEVFVYEADLKDDEELTGPPKEIIHIYSFANKPTLYLTRWGKIKVIEEEKKEACHDAIQGFFNSIRQMEQNFDDRYENVV
jgi:hypothetical protein